MRETVGTQAYHSSLSFHVVLIVILLQDGFRAPYLLGHANMRVESSQHRDSVRNTLDTEEWETNESLEGLDSYWLEIKQRI